MNQNQEKNIAYVKKKFHESFDPEVFLTEGYGTFDSPGPKGRKVHK